MGAMTNACRVRQGVAGINMIGFMQARLVAILVFGLIGCRLQALLASFFFFGLQQCIFVFPQSFKITFLQYGDLTFSVTFLETENKQK